MLSLQTLHQLRPCFIVPIKIFLKKHLLQIHAPFISFDKWFQNPLNKKHRMLKYLHYIEQPIWWNPFMF